MRERYTHHNIEVQVALLRNGLFKRDLAKILGLNANSEFADFFREEHSQEIQELMINTINLVGTESEPTQADLEKYKHLMEYVAMYKAKKRSEVDERTMNFVKQLEGENHYKIQHKERELDELCDKFDVKERKDNANNNYNKELLERN